ncbi:DNA-binding MarR family transcriptional regulator [Arthrobacter pigmenti]|uniref:DNA-binding MarR family transcriptional regulator n=1 Tax=Arthrobacter pigmenti TaxID=271432 RepID=A0A846RV69_9MICC|nr:hypothetical protein [Arthrobacter pigmenti]NJC24057.1 DNA-binding MarR family transcriptional regulator [Arthrobacter pigmenti]
MVSAQDPSASNPADSADEQPTPFAAKEGGYLDPDQSTRLMLTTAAHFVQQHLHDQLGALGLSPAGHTVLSGLADLQEAGVSEIAGQCLLAESAVEEALQELAASDLVDGGSDVYRLTYAGKAILADAWDLEDSLFAQKTTALRQELGTLISKLREGGDVREE